MIGNVCRKDLKIEINNETGDRNDEKIDGKCRNSKQLKIQMENGNEDRFEWLLNLWI